MNADEHIAEAERLLELSTEYAWGTPPTAPTGSQRDRVVARAQVHATLALALRTGGES